MTTAQKICAYMLACICIWSILINNFFGIADAIEKSTNISPVWPLIIVLIFWILLPGTVGSLAIATNKKAASFSRSIFIIASIFSWTILAAPIAVILEIPRLMILAHYEIPRYKNAHIPEHSFTGIDVVPISIIDTKGYSLELIAYGELEQIANFYRKELIARGWKLHENGTIFVKPGRSLQVSGLYFSYDYDELPSRIVDNKRRNISFFMRYYVPPTNEHTVTKKQNTTIEHPKGIAVDVEEEEEEEDYLENSTYHFSFPESSISLDIDIPSGAPDPGGILTLSCHGELSGSELSPDQEWIAIAIHGAAHDCGWLYHIPSESLHPATAEHGGGVDVDSWSEDSRYITFIVTSAKPDERSVVIDINDLIENENSTKW